MGQFETSDLNNSQYHSYTLNIDKSIHIFSKTIIKKFNSFRVRSITMEERVVTTLVVDGFSKLNNP
jgi:hypothetical protein